MYEGKKTFKIPFTSENNFMEFDECSEKFPVLFLSAKVNGPNKNIWDDKE